jgi:replicative DNA helicase
MNPALHSVDAEQALIGAMMIDERAIDRIDVNLLPAHFWHVDHQRIYAAIRRLRDAGKSCDALSVVSEMRTVANDEICYINELQCAALSAANVARHAEIVVERAMARALIAAVDEAAAVANDLSMPLVARIDAAQKKIVALSDTATIGDREPQKIGDLMSDYLKMTEARRQSNGGGTATGFHDLDRRLSGGMGEGALIVIAGRPAMGKTAMALNIADYVAEHSGPVLVCSQEMPSSQLIDRVISARGRIDLGKLSTGEMTQDEHDRFATAALRLRDLPLYLDEQGALRFEDVRRKARQVARQGGLKLLVIDYLQLMVGDGENRTRELTQITGAMKALAKELRIPIILLSQLNRKVEERPNKRPTLADLRESGSIEQDADVVLATYRDEYYHEDSAWKGLAELLVLKNRQGPAGGFVPMAFCGEFTRFDSMFGEWPAVRQPETAKKLRRSRLGDDD